MATTAPVRIPEEMLTEVKRIAALRGQTAGDALAQAWAEFIERHKSDISEQFDEVGRLLRERDTSAFLERTRSSRRARAEAAAAKLA
jgi:hypothetical protein